MDKQTTTAALVLSYLFECILLPLHAWQLAATRLAARRQYIRFAEDVRAEGRAFAELIRAAERLEHRAAEADLVLDASRAAVAQSLVVSLGRLRRHFATNAPHVDRTRQGRSGEQSRAADR